MATEEKFIIKVNLRAISLILRCVEISITCDVTHHVTARAPDKREYLMINFLISHRNYVITLVYLS